MVPKLGTVWGELGPCGWQALWVLWALGGLASELRTAHFSGRLLFLLPSWVPGILLGTEAASRFQ